MRARNPILAAALAEVTAPSEPQAKKEPGSPSPVNTDAGAIAESPTTQLVLDVPGATSEQGESPIVHTQLCNFP